MLNTCSRCQGQDRCRLRCRFSCCRLCPTYTSCCPWPCCTLASGAALCHRCYSTIVSTCAEHAADGAICQPHQRWHPHCSGLHLKLAYHPHPLIINKPGAATCSCSHPTVYTKPACAASFFPCVLGGTPDGTALSPSSMSTAPGKHCTNMCKPRPAANKERKMLEKSTHCHWQVSLAVVASAACKHNLLGKLLLWKVSPSLTGQGRYRVQICRPLPTNLQPEQDRFTG